LTAHGRVRLEEVRPAVSTLPVAKNSLESYLARIQQFPLLTAEEEFQLAVRFRQDHDVEAGQKLVTSNLRLVVKIAQEYRNYGVKLSDLIQEGNIGLMVAARKFDPYRGNRFISYAIWWVRAYIKNFLIQSWSLVKIGTTQAQRRLFYRIGSVRKALEADPENEKKYDILARHYKVTPKDLMEMEQRMSARDFSLDAPFGDGDELKPIDRLQAEDPSQEDRVAREEERNLLHHHILNAMKRLDERERHVIQYRILAEEPLTLREIGKHLRISRERVRQIEAQALKKLKREIDGVMQSEA
jgi:RNA polymerase sigma-32 factor